MNGKELTIILLHGDNMISKDYDEFTYADYEKIRELAEG